MLSIGTRGGGGGGATAVVFRLGILLRQKVESFSDVDAGPTFVASHID